MHILDEIVEKKKAQLEVEKKETSLEEMIEKSKEKRQIRDFESALSKEGVSVISEVKKASPSKGIIAEDFDPVRTAKFYEASNFDAISVLTEREYFLGDDKYIKMVRDVTTKPVLRKDFIVDEYQIYQSKVIGADAILLIARILKGKLKSYYDLAKSLGLHVLVEVHGEDEVEEALESGAKIIGVNNRNLETFDVDLKQTEKIVKLLPAGKIVVAESGIRNSEDVDYLKSIGASAVLVGETLMRGNSI